MSVESILGRGIRLLTLLVSGVLGVMLVAWVLEDPQVNLATDWTAFDTAADRILAGEDVYRPWDAQNEPLPYLYPPYALWLALPLALGGFGFSFGLSVSSTLAATVAGVRSALRMAPSDMVDRRAAWVVPLTSGAVMSSTLIGQYSGLLALSIAGSALLLAQRRHFAAGLMLAILCLKPNIAIAVPVVLVWSRSWTTLRGFAAGAAGLALLSLPFGIGAWQGFLDNAAMMAEFQRDDVVPFHKMITVQASLHEMTGLAGDSLLLWALWAASVFTMGVAVLQVWRPTELLASPARAFGVLALFTVAANARLYFYDGTLVAIGCLLLFVARPSYSSSRLWHVTLVVIVLTWPTLFGGFFLSLNPFVGPLAATLVVVTGLDSWLQRPDPPSPSPTTKGSLALYGS